MTTNNEEVLKPLLDRLSRDRVRLVCKVLDRLPDLLDMLDKSRAIIEMADGSAIDRMQSLLSKAIMVLNDCQEVKDDIDDLKDEVEVFRDESEEYRDECCSIKVDIMKLEKTRKEGREG